MNELVTVRMEVPKIPSPKGNLDEIQKNIDALKDGYVKYLIGQHADIDAQKSIITLTDHLILGKSPEKQDNYSSIDLLSRYNYHFY